MLVLGIETTCDETACAVVKDGHEILSNIVSTQIAVHQPFGGVVPELACRRHVDLLLDVLDRSLQEANVRIEDLSLIASALGPGLVGPLMIGINAGKTLAWVRAIPWVGVNHVEAHLYAALMSSSKEISTPCLGVVLSGGHTTLVLMRAKGCYEKIGQTVDDAVGEAFDKVAKILGLPYPGGPEIERLAKGGNPNAYPFSPSVVKGKPLHFSFSGLKTAVLYAVKGPRANYDSPSLITEDQKKHIAASFQQAAFKDIVKKTIQAAEAYGVKEVIFGGGVTCNQRLKEMFNEANGHLKYHWPTRGLSLDNGAMIAGLGYEKYRLQGKGDPLDLEASISMGF